MSLKFDESRMNLRAGFIQDRIPLKLLKAIRRPSRPRQLLMTRWKSSDQKTWKARYDWQTSKLNMPKTQILHTSSHQKKNPFTKPLLALLAAGLSKSLTTRRCMPSPMLNGSGPASRDGVAASWQETLATNANDMLKSSDEPEVLVETLIQMLMLGKKDAALCWCFCWSKGVYAPSVFLAVEVFWWLWLLSWFGKKNGSLELGSNQVQQGSLLGRMLATLILKYSQF